MGIFKGYVSLPEGTLPFYQGMFENKHISGLVASVGETDEPTWRMSQDQWVLSWVTSPSTKKGTNSHNFSRHGKFHSL